MKEGGNCCRVKCWVMFSRQAEGLLEPLHKIEMPLVRVLVDVEAIGVAVDEGHLTYQRCTLRLLCCRLVPAVTCSVR